MTQPIRIALLAAALAGALAACNRPPNFGPEAADFGNAVRHNAAVHTVNPEPDATPHEGMDAARAGLMLGRYRTDKVEPPANIGTSSIKIGE